MAVPTPVLLTYIPMPLVMPICMPYAAVLDMSMLMPVPLDAGSMVSIVLESAVLVPMDIVCVAYVVG